MNFRNLLALIIIVSFPVLWLLHGAKIAVLPDVVLGATVAWYPLVLQFYFRKKEAD